jgi:ABC-2 type transport system ATP-binding protein
MASIELNGVTLFYPIFDSRSRSLKNTVMRKVGGRIYGKGDHVEVRALSNISLRINSGDRVALVGQNGAGKTTLLKVLAGIYEPPTGRIKISGSISSLTDMTMGMDLEASGRENILMRCIFLGMTHAEAREKAGEIEAFTELGSYLDLPARTYSTGMLVRLGFAASTALSPDILVMDEMIGAGDMAFAAKASERVASYVDSAKILVLASHNNAILRQFCNRAIFIDGGEIRADGPVDEVISLYETAYG